MKKGYILGNSIVAALAASLIFYERYLLPAQYQTGEISIWSLISVCIGVPFLFMTIGFPLGYCMNVALRKFEKRRKAMLWTGIIIAIWTVALFFFLRPFSLIPFNIISAMNVILAYVPFIYVVPGFLIGAGLKHS